MHKLDSYIDYIHLKLKFKSQFKSFNLKTVFLFGMAFTNEP